MAARKKQKQINLLPKEEFAASTSGRVLTWTLSSFRVIVIVTEMFVMGAFLSRFWLDAKAADLNDEIIQKEAVIEATSEFEKEFRNTQKKISIFSALTSETGSLPQTLTTVTQYLPGDISLTSFSSLEGRVNVKGISPSEQGIAQFMENLSASGEFGEVNIDQLGSLEESSPILVFSLNVETQ